MEEKRKFGDPGEGRGFRWRLWGLGRKRQVKDMLKASPLAS